MLAYGYVVVEGHIVFHDYKQQLSQRYVLFGRESTEYTADSMGSVCKPRRIF